MVEKLVRQPPIQRFAQKGMWRAVAASRTMSWAWRLVPTKRTSPPEATRSSRNSVAVFRQAWVFVRSMIDKPWRLSYTKPFDLGFQRRSWWPKWTPESSKSCNVICMTVLLNLRIEDEESSTILD